MVKIKKNHVILLLLCLFIQQLYAQNQNDEFKKKQKKDLTENSIEHNFEVEVKTGYIFPKHGSLDVVNGWSPVRYDTIQAPADLQPKGEDQGREIGSNFGWMYGGVIGRYILTIPMLRGETGLTEGNNLKVISGLEINPVADFNVSLRGDLTLFPFLSVFASSSIGSGWVLADQVCGLSVLDRDSGKPEMRSFNGIVYKGSFGAEARFNLAAVLPEYNKWLNILFSVSGVFEYRHYSNASSSDAWVYGVTEGVSFNGWGFSSDWFIGYKIPDFPLDIVGVSLGTVSALGSVRELSTIDDNGWGSDFTRTSINLVTIWSLGERNSLQFVVMFNNNNLYTEDSAFYNDFRNWESEGDTYWTLQGIQLIYKLKI